jgi:signal transduction histidine kinase
VTTALPLAVVDSTVAVGFVALAAHAARNRDRPGATSAGLLWAVLAVLAGLVAASRAGFVSTLDAVIVLLVGWPGAVALWAGFAFAYTGRGPFVTRRWVVVGGLAAAAVAGSTLGTGAVGGTSGQLLRVTTSVLQVAAVGAGLFGAFLVVRSAVTDDLPATRGAGLALGGLGVALLLVSLSRAGGAGAGRLPVLTTGFLAATAGGFALAAFRTGLFDATPGTGHLARRTVFEEMGDAVVVVDREDRLVDANEAAERAFGVSVADDAGRPAAFALGFDVADAAGSTTTASTPAGRRTFDVSRSVLTTRRGDAVGASYLLRDVTDRRTREQRLEVFNRVLRHNLRNDLDAVQGFSEALADGVARETDEAAARIRDTASDLVDVGETVERADGLVTRERLDPERVDLRALAESVASAVCTGERCEVTVDATGADATVRTDRAVLRTALREVLENAVEHGSTSPASQTQQDAVEHGSTGSRTAEQSDDAVEDGSTPRVSVRVTPTVDGARLAVSDDGPGIPERERAVLLDGEETPLQHGTGVGLWFVSWAVTRLGGDLSFGEAGDGSEVVLDVPNQAT